VDNFLLVDISIRGRSQHRKQDAQDRVKTTALPGSQRTFGRTLKGMEHVHRGRAAMPYVTEAELVEIVPDLLALASVETSEEVRAALIRLADRYAAMADHPIPAIAT
jgi:hypothetical protein